MKINPLTWIAKKNVTQKYVNWATSPIRKNGKPVIKDGKEVTNYARLQKVIPPTFMCFLALVQCGFLATSNEMPKERKIPLFLANIYSCIIAFGISLLVNKRIDKMTKAMVKSAEKLCSIDKTKDKDKLINGIKTAVPALKDAVLFQYIGYVAAVPLGTQTTNWLAKEGYIDLPTKDKSI